MGRGTTLRVLNSVWGQSYLGGNHEKRLVAQLEVRLLWAGIRPLSFPFRLPSALVLCGDLGVWVRWQQR